jgi:hypothetical protein
MLSRENLGHVLQAGIGIEKECRAFIGSGFLGHKLASGEQDLPENVSSTGSGDSIHLFCALAEQL